MDGVHERATAHGWPRRLGQRAALLQVLEEASVAEVVDVSTEEDQFWVDVVGHTVVAGHGAAYSGWHDEGGGAVEHAVLTASHQGTKSEEAAKNDIHIY